MMSKLDEKTVIPLSLAIAVFGGGAAWMTRIHIGVSEAQAAIIEQKQADSEYHKQVCELLRSIDQRLSRIEGSRRKLGE